jgi:predicted nucleic acid-binding protein
MATYFADSSGLVKRHVSEIGSRWFSQIADAQSENTIIASRLSISEVFSAFNRRRRELSLSQTDYRKVAQNFEDYCQTQYQIIEITEEVTEKSRELLEKYSLRASDSIQLASAILTNENLKQANFSELIFLASDQKLIDAANGENLQNDNPQNHP